LPLAKQAFDRNPKDVPLLAEIARHALTQFQDDAVEELVGIARRAHVQDVNVLVTDARLALRRGQFDHAEEVLLRAIQVTEWNAWPYYYLGHLYVRAGRLEEALDVLHKGEAFSYEKEVKSRRVLSAIHTEMGKTYLFMDRVDLAAPIIESLVEEDPDSPEVARVYAALSIKRDGIQEAQKVLRCASRGARGIEDRSQGGDA
jgi:Flp pilus assembly protein TadD